MNAVSRGTIRSQVVALALVPALLIAAVLSAYFIQLRLTGLDRELRERGLAIARQLAPASEFGIFAGNREVLRRLAGSAAQEADVVRVVIADAAGQVLASVSSHGTEGHARTGFTLAAAPSALPGTAVPAAADTADVLVFQVPVRPSQTVIADFPGEQDAAVAATERDSRAIGSVRVEMSRSSTLRLQARELRVSVALAAICLLASLLVALRLSNGIVRPVRALATTVDALGEGSRTARVEEGSAGEIGRLEYGVNRMADRLVAYQQGLEERIAEATAELTRQRNAADAANLAKTQFLAAASHDLRQPMQALSLLVAALKGRARDPDVAHIVDRIEASFSALDGLLRDILDLSVLDAGVVKPTMKPFPIDDVFLRVHLGLATEALELGLAVRYVPSGLYVRSDPRLVQRIVMNLVSNAVRYTRQGGVVFGCRRRGSRVVIEVWDSGIGIADDHLGEIFREFHQVGNPERDRSKGLGLGLAIVARMAALLGTVVDVRSRLGHGSVFRFALERATALTVPDEPPARPVEGLVGRVVVVVDDDPWIVEALCMLLRGWGCVVAAGAGAAEAQQGLAAGGLRADLILCDFRLANGVTGLEAVASLRRDQGWDVPAVLLTGETLPESLREVQASGLPVLHKPIEPARLRAAMTYALDRGAAAAANVAGSPADSAASPGGPG